MNRSLAAHLGLTGLSNTRALWLVILGYLILSAASLTDQLPYSGDSATYLNLSENLLRGNGYRTNLFWHSGEGTMYPPLFPLVLAPALYLSDGSYAALKAVSVLLGVLSLLLIARLHDFGTTQTAVGIAFLTAVNPCFLAISTGILSEGLYLTLTLAALLSLERTTRGEFRNTIIPAVLMAAAFYTRTIGLSLPTAAVLYLFFRGERVRSAKIGLMFFILASPWILYNILPGNTYIVQALGSSPDSGVFAELLLRFIHNVKAYGGKVVIDLFGGPLLAETDPYNPLKVALSLVATVLILGGCLIRLADRRVIEVYVAVYLFICLIWPFHDWRFILPLLPFLFGYVIDSLTFVADRIAWPARRAGWGILVVATSLSGGMWVHHARTAYYSPEISNLRSACEWARHNTEPDAVILARKPRLAAVWSGRKTVWLSGTVSPATLLEGSGRETVYCVVNDFDVAGENLSRDLEALTGDPGAGGQIVFSTRAPFVRVFALTLQEKQEE